MVNILHAPIKMQRATERSVIFVLLMRASKMMLNTGVDMQMTMRSPMGITGTAVTTAKVAVEVRNPYRQTSTFSRHGLGDDGGAGTG